MKEKIKVCAYCRVSTNKEEQKTSFDNQKKDFHDYFTNSSEYELVKIYADEGMSGTSLNKRTEFIEMLRDCGLDVEEVKNKVKTKIKIGILDGDRQPMYKYIFVSNTSRFGRNIVQVNDIVRELKIKGVYVIFKDRGLSTEVERDMNYLPQMFWFDEMESSDKSKKVKAGHRKSASNSDKIHTNNRIYGYDFDKSNNKLEWNEKEAKNIIKIFEMYAENLGIRKILNYLTENGIKTRAEKDFSKSSISSILRNEKYAGLNARLKYDTGEVLINKHYPKLRPSEEWIVSPSERIKQIISLDTFNKCQGIRKGKVNTIKQIGVHHSLGKYVGLIKCDSCGSNYTKNVDKGRHYFNCSLKKTKGTTACSNVNINLNELETILEDYATNKLTQFNDMIKTKSIQKLEIVKQTIIESFDINKDIEVEQLNIELDELKEKEESLYDVYESHNISKKLYTKKWTTIQSRDSEVKEKIAELSKDNNEKQRDIQIINEEIKYILSIEVREKYTKDDVLDFIRFIEIRPYPHRGRYYSDVQLSEFYHIKRNGAIVGLVSIATKIDEKQKNIVMKYKHISMN